MLSLPMRTAIVMLSVLMTSGVLSFGAAAMIVGGVSGPQFTVMWGRMFLLFSAGGIIGNAKHLLPRTDD